MKISNEIGKFFGMPQEHRGEVSIQNRDVKITVEDTSVIHADTSKLLNSIGNKLAPEIRQDLAELFDEGMPVAREILEDLKIFLESFEGSPEEKLDTIRALLTKGLEINIENLSIVFETLYGEDISEIIKTSGIIDYHKESIGQGYDIQNILAKLGNLIEDSASLQEIADIIEEILETQDGIEPKHELALQKAANEIRQADRYNMEDLGKRIIHKTLNDISQEIRQEKPKTIEKTEEDYSKTDLASLAVSGKDFVMVEISERLRQIGEEFKTLKRQISNNLDMVIRDIKEENTMSINNARNTLEKTIEILDKTILKSDITLFTDMDTEKQLIKSSSELAKAKEYLARGQYEKAEKIVKNIKTLMDKINWKPSNTKVMHFASMKNAMDNAGSDRERLSAAIKHMRDTPIQNTASGRMIYESLRQLGIEHESDLARHLAGEDISKDDMNNNLKSILLKLASEDSQTAQGKDQLSTLADKITGQQLMSRWDKGDMQMVYTALPLPIGGELKDVKFFINSKKGKGKMDWRNCSIYFLLETKKLGETGILLQSSGRNLSITVKNDREDLEERIKPLLAEFKESLVELGYEVGSIGFAKLESKGDINPINKSASNRNKAKPIKSMAKGFDARI